MKEAVQFFYLMGGLFFSGMVLRQMFLACTLNDNTQLKWRDLGMLWLFNIAYWIS